MSVNLNNVPCLPRIIASRFADLKTVEEFVEDRVNEIKITLLITLLVRFLFTCCEDKLYAFTNHDIIDARPIKYEIAFADAFCCQVPVYFSLQFQNLQVVFFHSIPIERPFEVTRNAKQ